MHEDTNTPTGAEHSIKFCAEIPQKTVSTDTSTSLEQSQDSMQKSEIDCWVEMDTPSVIVDGIKMNLYFGPKEDTESLETLKGIDSIILPMDTPFSEVMRSSWEDISFSETAKLQIDRWGSRNPVDSRPNITVVKTTLFFRVGELGVPQNTSRTMAEDESIGKRKPKADEQTSSIAPESEEISTDSNESQELKERRARCKEHKKNGMVFLWNEIQADTPYRAVRGVEWFSNSGVDAQMFADFLKMSLADFRRLVNTVEKAYNKDLTLKNMDDTPIINESVMVMPEKELKKTFGGRKSFITTEGMFEIIRYLGSAR